MKTITAVVALNILIPLLCVAQETTFQDSLLDHMAGRWVLHGTIAGKVTTHDVEAGWVLGHQYMQIHELSRDTNETGGPAYEAIVFIGWDQPSTRYACLWLDVTGGGGLSGQAIGHARKYADTIAFVFGPDGGDPFHTTFAYDRSADAWQWLMDAEEDGKLEPFARVRLTRR